MLTGKINYSNASDTDLITLLREGNHAAYTEIFKRYYYLVFVQSYKKLRDEDQAKDIVQELFADLWFKREQTPVVNNLAGYLITAARNRILNLFEHQKVESKHIESLKNHVNTGNIAHTDYLVREKEQKNYIDKAIQSLPTKMRQVFQLNKKEDLSYQEIAEKLNTTENNIQKHINGAIKILRIKLTALF